MWTDLTIAQKIHEAKKWSLLYSQRAQLDDFFIIQDYDTLPQFAHVIGEQDYTGFCPVELQQSYTINNVLKVIGKTYPYEASFVYPDATLLTPVMRAADYIYLKNGQPVLALNLPEHDLGFSYAYVHYISPHMVVTEMYNDPTIILYFSSHNASEKGFAQEDEPTSLPRLDSVDRMARYHCEDIIIELYQDPQNQIHLTLYKTVVRREKTFFTHKKHFTPRDSVNTRQIQLLQTMSDQIFDLEISDIAAVFDQIYRGAVIKPSEFLESLP